MNITIADIEAVGRRTWSAEEQVDIDGWTVSSNGGFTRRVNSATSSGRPSVSLATKAAIVEWLASRGCPLVIRVTPLVDPPVVDEVTEAWGMVAVDQTLVMVRTAMGEETNDHGVTFPDLADPAFREELFELNRRPEAARDAWGRIITRMGGGAVGLWIPGKAVGIVAVDERIAAVYSVAVRVDARRQGLGSRIMAAAQGMASRKGVETKFLQVLASNDPAVGLYATLGYVERYRYHYLVPQP